MKRQGLWCVYAALLCAANGMQANEAAQRIDLGETPWKFTKIVREEKNLVQDTKVLCDGKVVASVCDGNIHTEWKSNSTGTQGNVWTIDLQKTQAVESVKLWFETDQTRQAAVQLEVSADGKTWKTLKADGEFSNIMYNPLPQTVSLPAGASARFIKLEATSPNGSKAHVKPGEVGVMVK